MKGLHLENMSRSPSPRKKNFSSASNNLAISIPKGFQENLLTNTLTTKLKQRQSNSNNKENTSRIISAKPPKQARKSSIVTRVSSKKEHSALDFNGEKDVFGNFSRIGSGLSSVQSLSRSDRKQLRVDSAVSDKLPRLSSRREASSRGSRRTVSADSILKAMSRSESGRISASSSFYPNSDSTGLAFEPTGADHTIKVIKRDGVFQPIDKYAPGRQGGRDWSQGNRGLACDYELFTLALCEDTSVPNSKQPLPVSRGKSDVSKRSMRVSWSHVMEHEHSGVEDPTDSRIDINPTPVLSNSTSRPTAKDTMAFKRPVYCSGTSRIDSIGVKWTVPSLTIEEEESTRQTPSTTSVTPSKPMWSFLLTPEPLKQPPSRVKSVGQLSRASKSKESPTPSSISMGRSTSMFDIRTQHCRDVHPVATAMDKQGTSVTKTKWHVPSSSSSTLDAKQVAMDRLQMVKRPGKRLVYDNPREDFDIALKFQYNNDNVNYEEEDDEEVEDCNESITTERKARREDDNMTTTSTTNTSPTKSRSTLH